MRGRRGGRCFARFIAAERKVAEQIVKESGEQPR